MKKIVTFGEIMLRLQPQCNDRIMQANTFDIAFGGGEANVAVCLSQLNLNAEFVTAIPDNLIGDRCVAELKKFGVITKNIIRKGERLGIYFCEKGYSERPTRVIYDRKNSAISLAEKMDFDFHKIFCDVNYFHFTGITAALSENALNILVGALTVAKEKGITVTCDLNYRKKLWTKEKAREVMSMLMQFVDVLIANEEDAKDIFGIVATESCVEDGKLSIDGYQSVCQQIKKQFNIDTVAITLRESFSANKNGWSALYYHNNQFYHSKQYDINVLDRVGGGDSFGAGLIYGLANDLCARDTIEFAVACSALKHSVNGDFNIVSEGEVKELLNNGGSGRVQR